MARTSMKRRCVAIVHSTYVHLFHMPSFPSQTLMSELYSRVAPTLRYESPYVSLQPSERQRCMLLRIMSKNVPPFLYLPPLFIFCLLAEKGKYELVFYRSSLSKTIHTGHFYKALCAISTEVCIEANKERERRKEFWIMFDIMPL
jgi:hypothetical protein